jgi:hypothetical protein
MYIWFWCYICPIYSVSVIYFVAIHIIIISYHRVHFPGTLPLEPLVHTTIQGSSTCIGFTILSIQ